MVRTSFSFDDDKELVKLARAYEDVGSRVSWSDVAHKMRRTGHAGSALKQRLRALMRTHGNCISNFPPCFFSPVRRSRGRPPAIVLQLRALSAPNQRTRVAARTHALQTPRPPRPSSMSQPASRPAEIEPPTDSSPTCPPQSGRAKAQRTLPLSTRSSEQAVHVIFAEVPRKLVTRYDGHSLHRNVGEFLPAGVSKLLAELDIGERDIFMDIGVGLGNVVAQVVLQTKVYRAIGIECQENVVSARAKAISMSHYPWVLGDGASYICSDVTDIHLSTTTPFEEATIVFWNNKLTSQDVIEKVKDAVCGMPHIRYLFEWNKLLSATPSSLLQSLLPRVRSAESCQRSM